MEEKTKEYDKIKYSEKDVFWAVTKSCTVLTVLLFVYFRFLIVETNTKTIKISQDADRETLIEALKVISENRDDDKVNIYRTMNEKDANTNRRLDTKTDRIESSVIKLQDEVDKLKEPNTDKK